MEEEGKLFVGALSWATTPEKLQEYFSKFGEVTESKVMTDKLTLNSRGFGFITFKDPSSVDAVLQVRPHILDEKTVDPKRCTTKDAQQKKKEAERVHVTTHKIFVGGLTQNMTEDEIKAFFSKFGTVTDVSFAINKVDYKNKGFGFITFENEKSVNEALEVHYHEVNGKTVEAKRAQPRERMRQFGTQQQQQQQQQQQPSGQMQAYNGYQNNQYGMGWNPNQAYGMQGANMMGPQSGYMPNSGYGGYGSNYMYPGYGYGYGGMTNTGNGATGASGYGGMGNYGNQSNSTYGPTKHQDYSKESAGDSKGGFHPYGR